MKASTRLGLSSALLAALLSASAANADPVAYNYTGVVAAGSTSLVGDTVTGVMTFDPSVYNPNLSGGVPGSAYWWEQTSDSTLGSPTIFTATLQDGDLSYSVNPLSAGTGPGTQTSYRWGSYYQNTGGQLVVRNDSGLYFNATLALNQSTAAYDPVTGMPLFSGPVPAYTNELDFTIVSQPNAFATLLNVTLESLTPTSSSSVPAPAGAGLLALGILGAALRRRQSTLPVD
jgi:MYXO-CTERM domain-containing protein